MDFSTEVVNDIYIVVVNLTRATSKEASALNELLNEGFEKGFKKVIIELHDLEYIDSTFLGVFVFHLKKLNSVNGKLRLVGFHPSVYTVVERTKLHRTFEIFESREEALKNI